MNTATYIVGLAMAASGVFLYAHGIVVDKKFGWKVFVGTGIVVAGAIVSLIISGKWF